MKRINVKVSEATHLELCKLSDARNKSFDKIIFESLKKDVKKTEEITKLKVELERLKPKELSPKEAWEQRVKEESNLPLMLSDFEVPCHYRAVTSKGDLYCDDKKMAKEVCERRQKRHLTMKRMCMPSALKKKYQKSPSDWQPKSGLDGDTKLWRG